MLIILYTGNKVGFKARADLRLITMRKQSLTELVCTLTHSFVFRGVPLVDPDLTRSYLLCRCVYRDLFGARLKNLRSLELNFTFASKCQLCTSWH
jgi:hypothetical protein